MIDIQNHLRGRVLNLFDGRGAPVKSEHEVLNIWDRALYEMTDEEFEAFKDSLK